MSRERRRADRWRLVLVAAAMFLLVAGILLAAPPAASTPAAPVVPSSGAGFKTLAAFTLPPTFYVGDRVELRIRVKIAPGTKLRAPAKMPTDRWITINSISISEGPDYSVIHIFFVSFAPGERALPPIDLGAITLRGIRVTTASLTKGGRARLSPPKGQLLLPGTTLIVGVIVALLIGLPLAFIFIFRRTRRALVAYIENYRARRPWRQLARALDELAKRKPPRDPRSFYIGLVDAVKGYLSAKSGRDFRAVTAREFSEAVGAAETLSAPAGDFAAIVAFGELVKFAGAEASEDNLERDLARVREITEAVETSERGGGGRQAEAVEKEEVR